MGAAPVLTILKNGETVRSVSIEGDASLGRDAGCVIRLEDRMISRQHALIRRKGDQIQIEKKSEFAPLLINGTDCTRAVLKDGDVISIGPYLVKVSSGNAKLPNSASPSASDSSTEIPAESSPEGGLAPVIPLDATQNINEALVEENVDILPDMEAAASPAPEQNPVLNGEIVSSNESPLLDSAASAELPVLDASSSSPIGLESDGSVNSAEANGVGIAADADYGSAAAYGGEADHTRVVQGAGPEMKLVLRSGDANVSEILFDKDQITIGRGKDCDIILNDKKASRKNTLLTRKGIEVTIKDLQSANGTQVNGAKITEAVLSPGDVIKIGQAEFEFRADQPGYEAQKDAFLPVPEQIETTSELPPFEMGSDAPAVLQTQVGAQAAPAEPVTQEIDGIAGIGTAAGGQKKSLFLDKFRKLPKRTQWIVIGVVLVAGYTFFLDDDESANAPQTKQTQGKGKKSGAATKDARGPRAFSALSKDKQDFVRTQHKLAFEYFQHKDYANALTAIKPIFEYVDEYEDSTEIQRYAEEGIKQLKVLAEEKAKKEAEEAKARKLIELIARARGFMEKKKYDDAGNVFNEILVVDPENAQVAQWQAKIREIEEDHKIQAQKEQVQLEVSNQAWAVYKEGAALKAKGQLLKAISVLSKVKDIGAVDARPAKLAATMIREIHNEITTQLEPLIKDGKDKEAAQDFVGAMSSYDKALLLDPSSSDANQGQTRVRRVLTESAKALYTEAVLAESYSDFVQAKKKFQQCADTAPKDSPYRERALRKLARYFKQGDDSSTAPAEGQTP